MLLTEEEVRRKIAALPYAAEPRMNWGGLDLPEALGQSNLLVAGTTGAGKTKVLSALIRSLHPLFAGQSRCKALLVDPKGGLSAELCKLSFTSTPIDFHSPKPDCSWDLAADMTSVAEVHQFAEVLIDSPPGNSSDFFAQAARTIVASVINSLRNRAGSFDLQSIVELAGSEKELKRTVTGQGCDHYLSRPEVFRSIHATILTSLRPLESVAKVWAEAPRKVSLKEWVKHGDSPLIFTTNAFANQFVTALSRAMIQHLAASITVEPDSSGRSRLWLFCDDLGATGKLDALPVLLNARRKGVRCALSLLTLEELRKQYQQRRADEILAQCGTITWLKLASMDTAQWASQHTSGAVPTSEFLDLPVGGEGVTGIHSIQGLGGVFRLSAKL